MLWLHVTELSVVEVVDKWALYWVAIRGVGETIYVIWIDGQSRRAIMSRVYVLTEIKLHAKILSVLHTGLVGMGVIDSS
jgi:hypothetical protein